VAVIACSFRVSAIGMKNLRADGTPSCTECYFRKPMDRLQQFVTDNKGTQLTPYKDALTKVRLRCAAGHEWDSLPRNVFSGSWCPQCATARGYGGAQFRMEEIAAERGMTLIGYTGSRDPMTIVHWDGSAIEPLPGNYTSKYVHPGPKTITTYRNVETGHTFIQMGDLPPLLPARIAELVSDPACKITPYRGGKAFSDAPTVRDIFDKLVTGLPRSDPSVKVMNVNRNPAWMAPGFYTWGQIDPFHNTLVPLQTPSGGQHHVQ
jgi:hypothetical protein